MYTHCIVGSPGFGPSGPMDLETFIFPLGPTFGNVNFSRQRAPGRGPSGVRRSDDWGGPRGSRSDQDDQIKRVLGAVSLMSR